MLPAGLLTDLCSAGFLKLPGSTYLRMVLPSVDWAPQHQLTVKAMAQDVPAGHSHGGGSSVQMPLGVEYS